MTLTKALELIDLYVNNRRCFTPPDTWSAIKIGREAIIRLQAYRDLHVTIAIEPLPGEKLAQVTSGPLSWKHPLGQP